MEREIKKERVYFIIIVLKKVINFIIQKSVFKNIYYFKFQLIFILANRGIFICSIFNLIPNKHKNDSFTPIKYGIAQ